MKTTVDAIVSEAFNGEPASFNTMKTTVDAIVSEAFNGEPVSFKLALTLEGGYPITEMATGNLGYVGWYDLSEGEAIAHAMLSEISRAKQALTAARQREMMKLPAQG